MEVFGKNLRYVHLYYSPISTSRAHYYCKSLFVFWFCFQDMHDRQPPQALQNPVPLPRLLFLYLTLVMPCLPCR